MTDRSATVRYVPSVDEVIAGAERLKRAERLTEMQMPLKRTPHGFYDPQGFVASCRYSAERNELFRTILASLREKEGVA